MLRHYFDPDHPRIVQRVWSALGLFLLIFWGGVGAAVASWL